MNALSLDQPRPDLAGKSEIYCIKHIATGKPYVGRSNDLSKRRRDHERGSHNKALRSMIEEHGAGAFTFEVLEICEISQLATRETYWIKQFKALKVGFNMAQATARRGDNPAIQQSLQGHIAKLRAANITIPEIACVDILNEPEANSECLCTYFSDEIEALVARTKQMRERADIGTLFIAPRGATYGLFKRKAVSK